MRCAFHRTPTRALDLLAALLAAWLGLIIVVGCAPTTKETRSWSGTPLTQTTKTNRVRSASLPPAQPAKPKRAPVKAVSLAPEPATNDRLPRYPRLTAVERSIGRVSTVNTQAMFVVVDFGFNPLPRPDQRLTVIRTNQAVGALRMTGAPRGSLMVADIMNGEAQVGDEVHED